MKTLNFLEIQSIVEMISEKVSLSPLQDVYCVDEKLSFGFYKDRTVHWIVIDLNQTWPFIGLFNQPFRTGLKTVKPVTLFIQSRFKNRLLETIRIKQEGDRIIEFIFNDGGVWEFRAIPKQVNFICTDQSKMISLNKIQELSAEPISSRLDQLKDSLEVRSIKSIFTFWQRINVDFEKKQDQTQLVSIYDKWKRQRERDYIKKSQALEKLNEQVRNPLIKTYQIIGEHLKTNGYKNLELEWPKFIDLKLRVSENIEVCFQKAKQLHSKSIGAQKRIDVLRGEMKLVQDTSPDAFERDIEDSRNRSKRSQLASKGDRQIQARKKMIDDVQGVTCYMGKSAQENVKLLKSAKSWYIWLHLKDYPSAYAILFYAKNIKLSETHVFKAAKWLVEESFKNKKEISGYKVKVVFAECRYVKLIKGDRLGRVTYSLSKELVISV
jgi:hypothetical protein